MLDELAPELGARWRDADQLAGVSEFGCRDGRDVEETRLLLEADLVLGLAFDQRKVALVLDFELEPRAAIGSTAIGFVCLFWPIWMSRKWR